MNYIKRLQMENEALKKEKVRLLTELEERKDKPVEPCKECVKLQKEITRMNKHLRDRRG